MADKKVKKAKQLLKKPTETSMKKTGFALLLTTLGIMIARGGSSYIPEDYQKYAKLGAGVVGFALGASTSDPTLKAVGIGVGSLGLLDGIQEIASKQNIENTKLKAFLGLQAPTSSGLNCPNKAVVFNPKTVSNWTPKTKIIEVIKTKTVNSNAIFRSY